jgi:hypothetical protein
MTARIQHLTLSAMFMALGIVIPYFFHAVGLGSMFLPMFWPVAVAAFFLPIPYAAAVGVLTPFLSFLVSGMPPPPTLYRMIFELVALSGSISYLHRSTRYGLFWITLAGLGIAMATGWLGALAIAPILGLPPEFYALISLSKCIPGMAIMIVIIPLILKRLKNDDALFRRRNPVVDSP